MLPAYRDVFLGANYAWEQFATSSRVAVYQARAAVVEFSAMRRVQAILVIVALLATPLALLARAVDPGMPDCDGMCCLPHGSHHHAPARNSSPQPSNGDMACHHGAAGHLMDCSMKSDGQRMDYGLSAPFPPAQTSALAFIDRPKVSRFSNSQFPADDLSAGFLAGPFQPPRS
ncbi:MAG: hypothetical protein WBS17_02840 [Candidatus Acidiferrales bacterium]